MRNVAIVAAFCAIVATNFAEGGEGPVRGLVGRVQRVFQHRTSGGVTLEQVTKQDANKNIIVYVGASWCRYCTQMKPVIESLKQHYIVYQIDADQHPLIVRQLKVSGLPTVVIFDKGKEVKRYEGVTRRDQIVDGVKTRQEQSKVVDYYTH